MIFNWILINKFAIGTPLTNQKDQLFLKEKKIISILDLRNESDLLHINHEKQLALYSEFNLFKISLPDHNSRRLATTSEIQNAVNILDKLCEEYLSLPKGEPCKELEKKHKKKYNVVDWKKVFEKVPSKRHYYFMKRNEYQFDYDKWKDNPIEEAANLYFLMKTGFNGIWQTKTWNTEKRGTPPTHISKAIGRFNTPCGLLNQGLNEKTGKFKEVYEKKEVLAWHKALQNCTLTSRDFKDTFEFVDKGSYVFLDPPYRGSFTQYGVDFDDKLQESVLDYFNSAKDKGAYVLLSNRDIGDEFFEERLKNNKIHYIDVTYTAGRRKKTENGFEAKKAKEILMY